jgi:diguanylate cyclase (GGDEF)-like protein
VAFIAQPADPATDGGDQGQPRGRPRQRGGCAKVRRATSHIDPVLLVLVLVGAVAVTAYAVDAFSPATQVAGCWAVCAVLHLYFAFAGFQARRIEPDRPLRRLYLMCALAGLSFCTGDLIQLVEVLRDPHAPTAVIGGLPQILTVVVGMAMPLGGLLGLPLGQGGEAGERSRMRLDLATVMVGAATLGIFLLQVPDGRPGVFWAVELSVALLVKPVVFMLTAFVLVKLLVAGHAPFPPQVGLLGGMSALVPVVLQGLRTERYPSAEGSGWLMAGTVMAAVLFASTLRLQLMWQREPGRAGIEIRRPYSWFPYAAMGVTHALLVLVLVSSGLTWRAWAVLCGAILSSALVVARQLAAFRHIAELLEERNTLAGQLTQLAFHDGLTGLPNRGRFMERLTTALATGPATVFLIDLNDFKPVNDRYGHAAGDQLLIEVGQRLRAAVRSGDTVARLGGDEFALLIEGTVGDRQAAVEAALRGSVLIGKANIRLSASVGVAYGSRDPDRLLHEADMAMYAMKRALQTAG